LLGKKEKNCKLDKAKIIYKNEKRNEQKTKKDEPFLEI
jgi:hypothetical protein